jgi:hypothetical protein
MSSQGSSVIVAVAEQRPERTVCVGGQERMETKEEGVVRIGFNNINGLGTQPNDIKNRQIYSFLLQHEFDIFGMVETNVHWRQSKISPKDITQEWFHRQHLSYAYYKDYPVQSKFQVGGVLQMAIGKTSSHIIDRGNDDTGQGRWSWQNLVGKNNVHYGWSRSIVLLGTRKTQDQCGISNSIMPIPTIARVTHTKGGYVIYKPNYRNGYTRAILLL